MCLLNPRLQALQYRKMAKMYDSVGVSYAFRNAYIVNMQLYLGKIDNPKRMTSWWVHLCLLPGNTVWSHFSVDTL